MSDKHEDQDLQARFEEAATGLHVDLEPAGATKRSAGIALVSVDALQPIANVGETAAPSAMAATDDDTIRSIITRWEGAGPKELLATWLELGTRPFVVVGPYWVAPVGENELQAGLRSEHFAEHTRKYPPAEPHRDIRVHNLKVVYLGDRRAVATYRLEETYTNGEKFAGNAGMVLLKDSAGRWKVAVFTKHEMGQDFVPA